MVELGQVPVALNDVHMFVVLLVRLDKAVASEDTASRAELGWLSKLLVRAESSEVLRSFARSSLCKKSFLNIVCRCATA